METIRDSDLGQNEEYPYLTKSCIKSRLRRGRMKDWEFNDGYQTVEFPPTHEQEMVTDIVNDLPLSHDQKVFIILQCDYGYSIKDIGKIMKIGWRRIKKLQDGIRIALSDTILGEE